MRGGPLVVLAMACGTSPDAPQPAASPPAPAPAAPTSAEQHVSDATAGHPSGAELACEDAIGDPALYPSPLRSDSPQRDWVISVRRRVLVHECGHGWSGELKRCLVGAGSAEGVARCLDQLAADERDELTGELAELDQLAARMAAAHSKPSSLECKRVVAAHYGDARWKGKLASYSASQRKKLIADSRARMSTACIDDAWTTTLRACIVAGGENTCFESFGMALSWGYPAAGVVDTTGIPECDAYGKMIERVVGCDALSAETRDALRQMYAQTKAAMAGVSANDRAKLATSCRAGRDAIEQIAAASGC
jgi:hypothetical protein